MLSILTVYRITAQSDTTEELVTQIEYVEGLTAKELINLRVTYFKS